MNFPWNIFTLPGVGMEAVFTDELKTGITFNDKMTLMVDSQPFLVPTNNATGMTGQITCRAIILISDQVFLLIRAILERRDWITALITSENHLFHNNYGFTYTVVSFPCSCSWNKNMLKKSLIVV